MVFEVNMQKRSGDTKFGIMRFSDPEVVDAEAIWPFLIGVTPTAGRLAPPAVNQFVLKGSPVVATRNNNDSFRRESEPGISIKDR